ncbi:MAG: AAA family ATPase [Methylomonas sp.]|nr:AAA family ATPase [Methylomonas sp.]
MLDNDDLTYSKLERTGNARASRAADRLLLTQDRSQKLDLLIHLLTNLHQSLIVCGPEGIGKTTLLSALQTSHKDTWPICLLQGSDALSFEAVITALSQFLRLSNSSIQFDMTSLRAFCEKQKVVLLIDDAERLVPGLIDELIEFADSLSGLRMVFAMNDDEFRQEAGSDRILDTCHLIELPPLSQRQCLDYLQNLSAQPGAPFSFNAITDSLVEDIYRQTQGIPGKLLAQLPKLDRYQSRRSRKIGLISAIFLMLAVAGFVAKSWLPIAETEESRKEQDGVTIPAPGEKSLVATQNQLAEALPEIGPSVETASSQTPAGDAPPAVPVPQPVTSEPTKTDAAPAALTAIAPHALPVPAEELAPHARELKPDKPAQDRTSPPDPHPDSQPPVATEEKPANSPAEANADVNDLEWIQAQPAGNYTVQLMVLSSQASALRFIKKYSEYRDNLKYYTIEKNGQEKFVLIYGSFLSSVDAMKRKSTMPNEFSQGMVKQFKYIHRESRRQ